MSRTQTALVQECVTTKTTMRKYHKPRIINRKLGREGAWGQYEPGTRTIELDPRMSPQRSLGILVHESLHHLQPDMSESAVEVTAARLARILWEQDYRKVHQ